MDRCSFKPPNDRPVFLWEDEAHYFTIEQDAEFQTTARSKGISVVRLTQNLPNFLDAYVAALNRIPVITQGLHWVADRVYEFLPALARLPGAQVPILAASAVVGIVFFLFTIPFSYWLAGVFARAGYVSMERQTTQLKRFREKQGSAAFQI